MPETCENCGRSIGKLERACVIQQHIVCVECHGRLASSAASATAPPGELLRPRCPICGFEGPAVRKEKGSARVLLLLVIIFFPAAIYYAIAYSGSIYVCPACGAKRADRS